ncbi:10309_t:CDS:10 [Ambispora leptoticha]|uniref:DNA ligase n=1 Tax=Ambispora leptoticha TaxID=144679 RepID=A0A9N8V7D4_9GLOM|nr:10309_t:CDS:10 [Ambispora leptoticha]
MHDFWRRLSKSSGPHSSSSPHSTSPPRVALVAAATSSLPFSSRKPRKINSSTLETTAADTQDSAVKLTDNVLLPELELPDPQLTELSSMTVDNHTDMTSEMEDPNSVTLLKQQVHNLRHDLAERNAILVNVQKQLGRSQNGNEGTTGRVIEKLHEEIDRLKKELADAKTQIQVNKVARERAERQLNEHLNSHETFLKENDKKQLDMKFERDNANTKLRQSELKVSSLERKLADALAGREQAEHEYLLLSKEMQNFKRRYAEDVDTVKKEFLELREQLNKKAQQLEEVILMTGVRVEEITSSRGTDLETLETTHNKLKQNQEKYAAKFLIEIEKLKREVESSSKKTSENVEQLDKEGAHYRMKEANLAKMYIDVLGIGRKSETGQRLVNWKMPGKNNIVAGDFASVAYDIIAPRSTVIGSSKITINEVNHQLDLLNAASSGKESQKVIRYFFDNFSPDEQKWIIRIILKELKLGMSEKSVFQVYHPDAEDLFNVCSSLKKVCDDLQDPSVRLTVKEISLFNPIKPMLAKLVPIQEIVKLMGGNFWIEQKLDGERIHIHKRDREYKYFSRRATDYTELYGSNRYEGSLTPFIYDCFDSRVKSCIIDGEMVTWDPIYQAVLPFGSLKTAGLDRSTDENKARPCFVIFDILYCNGKVLIEKPLSERQMFLRKIVKEKEGHLIILEHKTASTQKELVDVIETAIQERQEGVIVKNPSSAYTLNTRNNDWIKIKPEYMDSLGDSLDLLVIGGLYGIGKRRDMVGSFFCGLRDASSSEPKFLAFCRIGTGFTMENLKEFNKNAQDWKPFDANKCPSWLSFGKDKPDVIIAPNKSFVAQVKAAEIIPAGDSFAVPYTLRFPRFEKVREDKDWKSAMSFQEMMDMKKYGTQSKNMSASDFIHTTRLKRRKANGPPKSKQELQRQIKEHGGNLFQHPEGSAQINVISDSDKYFTVKNLIKKEKCDIIHPKWITDCIEAGRVISLSPKYMVFTTEATEIKFRQSMDEWGDSYIEEVTIEDIKEILNRMPSRELSTTDRQQYQLLAKLQSCFQEASLKNLLSYNSFLGCLIYLDVPSSSTSLPLKESNSNKNSSNIVDRNLEWAIRENTRDRFRLVKSILKYQGAEFTDDINNSEITHIVVVKQADVNRYQKERSTRGVNILTIDQMVKSY